MAEEKTESGISLSGIQIFLGIFVLTYFLWYIGGGPERWESKFEHLTKQKLQENIAGNGVFLIDKNR